MRKCRLALLVAVLLCAAHPCAAQEKCELERAIAPDYGGVMLGMSVGELKGMFPGSRDLETAPATKPGVFKASLGMLELSILKEAFKNVEELELTFIGGKLGRINVSFLRAVPWADVTEFSARMSKKLALPADAWSAPVADSSKHSRVMDCRGFAVVVRVEKDGRSSLSIVDTTAGEKTGNGTASRANR